MKIGVDIGGSHIGVGLVDDNGSIALKIEKFIKDKTNIKKQIEEFITETIIEMGLTHNIESIGIAIPGTVTENKIIKAVNLGIEDYELEIEYSKNKKEYAEFKLRYMAYKLLEIDKSFDVQKFCNNTQTIQNKSERFFELLKKIKNML